ncbi:hypothetical protein B0H14DRAFT_3131031, partial [Mycena olivaceomarginata]
ASSPFPHSASRPPSVSCHPSAVPPPPAPAPRPVSISTRCSRSAPTSPGPSHQQRTPWLVKLHLEAGSWIDGRRRAAALVLISRSACTSPSRSAIPCTANSRFGL